MKRMVAALLLSIGLIAAPYIGQAAKVVIDPGHGGRDPGAIGVNGLYEKIVNDGVSYRLQQLLLDSGYEVVMTRGADTTLSLEERVHIARNSGADIFVSVHANSHPSSSIRGTMVLYHDKDYPNPNYPASEEMKTLTPQSRQLAQLILTSVLEQVPNDNRGLLKSSAYVVRMGNIPSVLVETAFLSNKEDAKMLALPAVREKYAVGIFNGILQYLAPVFRDVGRHWARDSIMKLNEKGIAGGNNGKFHPDQPLTRAELVAFVQRAFGFASKVRPVIASYQSGEPEEETVTNAVYGNDGAAPEQPDAPGQADTPEQTDSPEQTGTPEQTDSPGQADTPEQTDSPEQTGTPEQTETPVFGDLSEMHWAYGTMSDAIRYGVIRGYPDGTVRPDAPVSRAEVAVVMDRLVGASTPEDRTAIFIDVSTSSWAYDSIMRLGRLGIVRGVAEQQYGPERSVTRAEMATIIDRQLSLSAESP